MSRITIVHQIDPREFRLGGVEGVIRDLVRFAPPETRFDFVGVDTKGNLPAGAWVDVGIGTRPCRFMPVATLDPAVPSLVPHTARLMAGLLRYRSRIEADDMHAHRSEIGAVCARLLRHRRLIQFLHGDTRAGLGSESDSRWRFAPGGLELTEALAARAASEVVVFSRSGASRLAERFQHVRYSPAWFDAAVFTTSVRPRRPQSLIFVGRLEAPKDPLLFVEVVRRLRDGEWPDATATIVGDGSVAGRVRRRIEDLRLAGSVRMLGARSGPQVADELGSHAVCLVPSHFEGPTPRVVLESLACGTPAVATHASDPDRLLGAQGNGALTERRDAHVLARLVVEVAGADPLQVASTVVGQAAHRVIPGLFAGISDAGR